MLDSALDAMQWPAMAITLLSAWLIASQSKSRRSLGFWCFVLSNGLWVIWGWHAGAYALIGLQIGLLVLTLRGAHKSKPTSKTRDSR